MATFTTTFAQTVPIYSQHHASEFSRVIDACNKFDGNLNNMWAFYILSNSRPVGYIPHEFVQEMEWGGTLFSVSGQTKCIHLNPALAPGDDGIEVCKQECIRLCEINRPRFGGCLDRWLNSGNLSYHAIRWLDRPLAMFHVPTPLRGILGVVTAGVHLNVYTLVNSQPYLWISKRSHTTSYPGMLDQIVAGTMDPEDGSDPWNTLQHEALEEAYLVLDRQVQCLKQNDVNIGSVQGPGMISFYDRKDRSAGAECGHIEPGVRFTFDMEVSPTFVATPGADEAVGGFLLKSVLEVKRDLLRGSWKPNSGLVTLDFFIRKGYIVDSGDGTVGQLRARLQRQLPMATA